MKILFESQVYDYSVLHPLLPENLITSLKDNKAKTDFVGYYLGENSHDPVFILPKVFIDKDGKPLGKSDLTFDQLANSMDKKDFLNEEEIKTVSRLSFWLYQAIKQYKEDNPDSTIVKTSNIHEIKSEDEADEYTLIDIIQSLRKFNHDHQDLFTFIVNTNRSGVHNINWSKTIRKVQPILQDGEPIYLQFYNKKKIINFDEEIIILFYSVIEYLKEKFFFDESVNFNFNLIEPYEIDNMIESGQGTLYLNKIRHKYFTDDLVNLWNLLHVFFDKAEKIRNNNDIEEEVLSSSFNTVFEDMVDLLVGSSDTFIKGLRNNKDGKIIDHLYEDQSLINNGSVYFIADSKYYKEVSDLGENSVYKQFTYAKNIIQYNLNIFQKNGKKGQHYKPAMRDDLTEGYNIVPNFFIRGSAIGEKGMYDYDSLELVYKFDDDYAENDKYGNRANKLVNYHFSNRLFDRDTLVLQTYNINFLYVLAKYVEGGDEAVKAKIHKQFRDDLIIRFNKLYSFYRMEPINMTLEDAVEKHFKKLIGKVIQPYKNCGYMILALERGCITKESKSRLSKENDNLFLMLMKDFNIYKYILK